MVRIRKEHEERKDELLDIAQEFLDQNSHRGASVDAIIEKAGVSRGAFYHYFRSMKDLLDCLVGRTANRILEQIKQATRKEGMDAIGRFNAYFAELGRWKAARRGMMKAIYADENFLLRYWIVRRAIELGSGELADIIRQGVHERVFDTTHPEDTAEIVLQLGFALQKSTVELLLTLSEKPGNWPLIERKARNCENAIARVLGASEGSVQIVDTGSLEAFRN